MLLTGHVDGMPMGAGRPSLTHWCELRQRRLQDVMVLRREVDAVVELLAHQHVRRRVGRDDVRERRRPVVDRRHLDRVVVGVGCSGDLPHPKSFGVGLSRAVIAQPTATDEVRLGDDRQHRHPQVGAKRDRLRRVAVSTSKIETAVQRRGGTEPRVHQETVVDPRERIDGVDVRRQEQRRLRLAQRDHCSDAQPAAGRSAFAASRPAWEKMS